MARFSFLLLAATLVIALCVAGFMLGRGVPFAQQWPLYEALRNTASIIFAVVGAWLAIIYPERLKLSFGKESVGPEAGSANLGLLLLPAVHSTILLVVLLLVGVIAPLLKQLPALMQHVTLLRGLSYAGVVALTCWQVVIVVMTLFPAETVQTSIDRERAKAQIDSQRGKLRRK